MGGRREKAVTVAAIVPTYCRSRLLSQSINSILGQTHAPDCVIVIDDGSTDDTSAVLQTYGDRIRYLYQNNAGKPAAVNRALATVDADYIWIMDDDDVAVPDALERHLHFLNNHRDVDFSYSGLYAFKGSDPPPPPERCRLWQYPAVPREQFLVHIMENAQPNLQTMLVPRRCYEAVGPLDEELTFCEDYDIVLRLARHYTGGRLERPAIYYREHAGVRGPAHERYAASERKRGWLKYEKKIFSRLYATLDLSEYLPRRNAFPHLSDGQRRHALLERACIMARHGVFSAALDDLCTVTADVCDSFTSEEQAICRRMLDLNPLLEGRNQFLQQVADLLRERAPALFVAVTKGILWRSRRKFREGDMKGAAEAGRELLRIAGLRDLINISTHRVL